MQPDSVIDQLRADFALVWKTLFDRGDAGVPRICVMAGGKVVGIKPDTSRRDAEAAEISARMRDTAWIRDKASAYAELAAPIRSDLARSERIRAEVRAAREAA